MYTYKYHERAEINGKIQRVMLPSVVEEDDISNDCRLHSFCWASTESVQAVIELVTVTREPIVRW